MSKYYITLHTQQQFQSSTSQSISNYINKLSTLTPQQITQLNQSNLSLHPSTTITYPIKSSTS